MPGDDPYLKFTDETTGLFKEEDWAMSCMDRIQKLVPSNSSFKCMKEWFKQSQEKILAY